MTALRIALPSPQQAYSAARRRRAAGPPPRRSAGQPLTELAPRAPRRLRIVYLVPRTDVGGGARVLLEHTRRLSERGHDVLTIAHTPPPTWTAWGGRWQQLPPGIALSSSVPAADVVVAGYWDMLGAASLVARAPLVHFEQGDFHLFETLHDDALKTVRTLLRSTPLHMTVSGTAASVMRARYGVDAAVLHNAVDAQVFRPGPAPAGSRGGRRLLCVGSDANAFKGIDVVLDAWRAARQAVPGLELTWVTPRPPTTMPDGVRVVVSPDQRALAQEYRRADAYVSASRYESFGLPALEAMACGTPVVTTANVGVLEYARDGENALVVDIDDADALTSAVLRVLQEADLARTLRTGGLATAAAFSWDEIVDRLERLLAAAADSPVPGTSGDPARHWRVDLHGGRFDEQDGDERLRAVLQVTPAGSVAVPVRQPAIEGHDLVRWRVVAKRRGAPRTTDPALRLWLPATSERPVDDHPCQRAIDALRAERGADAVRELAVVRSSGGADELTLSRWLVLALLECGQDEAAAELVQDLLHRRPEHPDLAYLAVLAAALGGLAVDRAAAQAVVASTLVGATASEWFAEPHELLRRLDGSGGAGDDGRSG